MLNPEDDPITTFAGFLEPAPIAHVATLGSIWLIDDTTYVRMPKTEALDPTRSHEAIDGRLNDFVHHPYRAAWFGWDDVGEIVLRLLPVVGPSDGIGLVSSPVMTISGCTLARRTSYGLFPDKVGGYSRLE
jgi:hypothetical protein